MTEMPDEIWVCITCEGLFWTASDDLAEIYKEDDDFQTEKYERVNRKFRTTDPTCKKSLQVQSDCEEALEWLRCEDLPNFHEDKVYPENTPDEIRSTIRKALAEGDKK